MNGKRTAATIGGRTALSAASTNAAARASSKFPTDAPGTIFAASNNAAAETSQASSSRNTRNRGRPTPQVGARAYSCLDAVMSADSSAYGAKRARPDRMMRRRLRSPTLADECSSSS